MKIKKEYLDTTIISIETGRPIMLRFMPKELYHNYQKLCPEWFESEEPVKIETPKAKFEDTKLYKNRNK